MLFTLSNRLYLAIFLFIKVFTKFKLVFREKCHKLIVCLDVPIDHYSQKQNKIKITRNNNINYNNLFYYYDHTLMI